MTNKIAIVSILSASFLLAGSFMSAQAGMFDDVAGTVGIGSSDSGSSVSPSQLNEELSGLNGRISSALSEMLTAQAMTAVALGQKAKGEEYMTAAKSLEGKTDINTISRSIEISTDAAKQNQAEVSKAQTLDASSKVTLGNAVVHYGKGTVVSAGLPAEYSAWGQKAQGAVNSAKGNPMAAATASGLVGQISDVAGVTAKLPDLISAWSSSTKAFVSFAHSNDVDTGDLASKI